MNLQLPTLEQLTAAYETRLCPSFPPAELKPLHTIRNAYSAGKYLPYCLFDGREILGACFLWPGRPGWMLLDYLCTAPERRNCGLGTTMIDQMRSLLPDTVILIESEAPEEAPDPALAVRRLGFYIRNGAHPADYDTKMFGVHYRSLYWADKSIPDTQLMEQHRFIYASSFAAEKFARYVRIPLLPDTEPMASVPWNQEPSDSGGDNNDGDDSTDADAHMEGEENETAGL